jgi:hypothetical protein
MVLKFIEHFYYIAAAMNQPGPDGMWDEEDGFYYDLLRAFERLTGCPVVVNTSFTCAVNRSSALRSTPTPASCAPKWTIWCG